MRRVAFVMVNHNGGEETVLSAHSVLEDLGDEDTLILVDNGTTDGSGEKAAELSTRVVHLAHAENLPFAEATNRGLKLAMERGYRYAGPINPDVRIVPSMTEALVRTLAQGGQSGMGAVSPVMLYERPEGRIWFAGGRILWPFRWMLHRGNGRRLETAYRYAGETSYLTGCCWLASRNVWEKVGLLDETYGMYSEDVDWSVRARRSGLTLHVEPLALLVHRLSQSSGGGRSKFKMTYRTLASRLFFRRFTPGWMRPVQWLGGNLAAYAYAIFLLMRGERGAASSFLRAWRMDLGDRLPWPPSRQMIES